MYVHANVYCALYVTFQVCHWAEIQARSRKMSTQQFLDMAEQKKQQLRNTLEVRPNVRFTAVFLLSDCQIKNETTYIYNVHVHMYIDIIIQYASEKTFHTVENRCRLNGSVVQKQR